MSSVVNPSNGPYPGSGTGEEFAMRALATWGGEIPVRGVYIAGATSAGNPLRLLSRTSGFELTGSFVPSALLAEGNNFFLLPEPVRPITGADFRAGILQQDADAASNGLVTGTPFFYRGTWSDPRSLYHHMVTGVWPGTASGTVNELRITGAQLTGLNCRGIITRSIGTNKVSLMIPRDCSDPKLLLYEHGAGGDYLSHISSSISVNTTSGYQMGDAVWIQTMLAAGYFVLAHSGGTADEGTANNDTWFTEAAYAHQTAALDWVDSLGITFSKSVVVGKSMGGGLSLRAVAYRVARTRMPAFSRWYGVSPVCSLKGPANDGQASVAAWTATLLARHGVGSIAALPATCDPSLFPASVWTGKAMAATVSSDDTSVPTAKNLTLLQAAGATVTVATTTGAHGLIAHTTSALATHLLA